MKVRGDTDSFLLYKPDLVNGALHNMSLMTPNKVMASRGLSKPPKAHDYIYGPSIGSYEPSKYKTEMQIDSIKHKSIASSKKLSSTTSQTDSSTITSSVYTDQSQSEVSNIKIYYKDKKGND